MTTARTNVTDSSPKDFQNLELAFLGSLLPGIIHNWATPLSGVIGATHLLEKRASVLEELTLGLDRLSDAERDELKKQFERNRTNVEILSRNAQHLADLLQILVYRITRGSSTARDMFPLNELMENELRFLESNLQFKHKVKKELRLSPVAPESAFTYGWVAAAVDDFVTCLLTRQDPAATLPGMLFATGSRDGEACLRVEATVTPPPDDEPVMDCMAPHLGRLRSDGWLAELDREQDRFALLLRRPERPAVA